MLIRGAKVVNPGLAELFGEKSYPDVLSIPGPVDVVDIFRDPAAVPEIVEQAIKKQARVVWMQPGAAFAASVFTDPAIAWSRKQSSCREEMRVTPIEPDRSILSRPFRTPPSLSDRICT